MKRNKVVSLIIIIFVLVLPLSLLTFSFIQGPVSVQADPDPIDLAITDSNAKVNPIYARGDAYSISINEDGTYTWSSDDVYVYNGSRYVPYSYSQDGDHYTVQTGLIGAKLYRNKAVFYDENLERQSVGRETWLVFQRVSDSWVPICASLTPYFQSQDVTEDGETLSVIGTWETVKGTLSIEYRFRENLKHTVSWIPNQAGTYAIIQFWNETTYNDVELGNNTVIRRNDGDLIIGATDSLRFLFFDENETMFGVFEDQASAKDMLHKTIFAKETVNYQGITITDGIAWIFYNSSKSVVDAGEPIIIDPATQSSNNPYIDGFCREGATPAYELSDTYARIAHNNLDRAYRSFWRYTISGIDDAATITNATLEFNIYYADGTTDDVYFKTMFEDSVDWVNNGQTLLDEIKNGVICGIISPAGSTGWYTAVFDQDAFDLIEYELTDEERFQFGAMLESEEPTNSQYYYHYNEEQGSPDKPRCNITYSVNEAPINDACAADATFDVDADGWVNGTVYDENGGYLDLETVEINVTTASSEVFILRWTNDTGAFTELSDSSNVCTLNAGTSERLNVNASADKFCFYFKVNVAPIKGACSVNLTSVDSMEESDSDVYSSKFSINFYLGITINDSTHSWSSMNPGTTDQILGDDGDIDVTIDANANFNLEAKGDGALASGENTIALSKVEMHETTLGSAIDLTTSYQDIPGLTDETRGTSQAKAFKLWISIPNPQPDGSYTYTLSVKGAEH